MNEQKQQIFAVDGDTLAYRTAAVCENHFEGACSAILKSTLRDIVTDTQITNLRIYLSGADNFRYKIAKTKPYKGNRDTMVKPAFLQYCREFLINEMQAIVVNGFEADDAIATDMVINGAIHCGVDKDIFQIPGRHYNYVKKEWREITQEEAILLLYRQILMGDASDNVPGLPRIGEAKAAAAIQSWETAELDAIRFYEDVVRDKMQGVNHMEYFQEQFNLISMVRDVPLDFSKVLILKPDTQGFSSQAGGLEAVEEEKPKFEVKL